MKVRTLVRILHIVASASSDGYAASSKRLIIGIQIAHVWEVASEVLQAAALAELRWAPHLSEERYICRKEEKKNASTPGQLSLYS